MTRLMYRYGPVEDIPAILAQVTTRERFRRSCEALGILHAEPVELFWTDVDDDGAHHLIRRWIVATAYAVKLP